MPELNSHLRWLWRLIGLAPELVQAGARRDLADRCTGELRRRSRAAVVSILDAELSSADAVHSLIATGLAAAPVGQASWTDGDKQSLKRLWTALPAAAAIAAGDLFNDGDIADAAVSRCGDSLTEILKGHPDPHAVVGRFGQDAERMATFSPEQVEAVWQAANVVPQAMLDADTRAAAARRMFHVDRHGDPRQARGAR